MSNEAKTVVIWDYEGPKEDIAHRIKGMYRDYDIEAIYEFEARKDKGFVFLVNSRRLY